jgi:hypothetical protein
MGEHKARGCRQTPRSERSAGAFRLVKRVVRGGVEPPTFRFSEGLAGPGRSTRVRPTGPDDVLAPFGVRDQPQISTVVVSKELTRSTDEEQAGLTIPHDYSRPDAGS